MKILALKDTNSQEKRVAITPDVVTKYQKLGFEVFIEYDAGISAFFTNLEYEKSGAKIVKNINDIISEIDVVVSVQNVDFDYGKLKENACIIALVNPVFNKNILHKIANHNVNLFALDYLPRITRAQSMDVLSSQSNLAG
ncbi:MAG: NAD(P)(+) transhydrogenase (Re/Si-specific) subunit alpha, partial [Alphaproteobacteria bacterium]